MQFSKVTALPATPVKDHIYFVSTGTTTKMFVTDKATGEARPLSVDVNTSFGRYDLTAGTTTGAIDLAVGQVYKVVNNTAATNHPITFTNIPANKAMTAVVTIEGNAGTVSFPSVKLADGVDITTLGTTRTICVIFFADGAQTLTSAIRVNT